MIQDMHHDGHWRGIGSKMRYYIADCHFFHGNLNERMDCRGFESAEAMNEYMINQWNQKVRPNDEVVILGDFSCGKAEETNEICRRLQGRLYLVEGNHDYYLKDRKFDLSRFEWVKSYAELHDEGRKVILSHYPTMAYNGQFHMNKEGEPLTYMLYGHVHNTFDEYLMDRFIKETRSLKRMAWLNHQAVEVGTPCHMINCFCRYSDYVPLTLKEWVALDEKRRKEIDQVVEEGRIAEYFH